VRKKERKKEEKKRRDCQKPTETEREKDLSNQVLTLFENNQMGGDKNKSKRKEKNNQRLGECDELQIL